MLDKKKNFSLFHPDPVFALGRHITIEYCECASDTLVQKGRVENILLEAAEKSGATIVSSSFHQFEPQGVSGVVIIAESHFSVHAWPEYNYAAVDIFTCGDSIDLDTAISSMQAGFSSQRTFISSDRNRGAFNHENQVCLQPGDEMVRDKRMLPATWKKAFEDNSFWGISTCVDLYECDPGAISDASQIDSFVTRLCEHIDIKAPQKAPQVYYDQDDSALVFTTAQSVGTATISGHFARESNCAYLDIFSCKFYDPRKSAEFALSFFQGDHYRLQVTLRQ